MFQKLVPNLGIKIEKKREIESKRLRHFVKFLSFLFFISFFAAVISFKLVNQIHADIDPTTIYGPGIALDGLANTVVGGPENLKSSYRFRAKTTSNLNSIRVYIMGPEHPGYGGGTGGSLRFEVQTDDGTTNHLPSGTVLATTDVVTNTDDAGKLVTWSTPASLISGTLYHVVFTNIDPSPTVNYVSVDNVYQDWLKSDPTTQWQPQFSNTDWATMYAPVSVSQDFLANGQSGYIESDNATYLTARSGSTVTVYATSGVGLIGQDTGYLVSENFLNFDTSALTGKTIQSAVLSIKSEGDYSDTDFNIEARLYDWGSTLTSADWVPGGNLGNYTLLAHMNTSSYGGNYLDFTDDAFANNVNTSGNTRIILDSDRTRLGTTPTGHEYTYAGILDSGYEPRLRVTYAGTGAWTLRDGYTPIADFTYANGVHQGMGYMELSYGTGEIGEINGTSKMAREAITVSGGDRLVSGAAIRILKTAGGTDPLTVTLQNSSGTSIDSFTIPATSIPDGVGTPAPGNYGQEGRFVTGSFSSQHTLTNGSTYYLRLSTGIGTSYYAYTIRKGVEYSYDPTTYFADGKSQKATDGSTWSSLGRVTDENDLQFYFQTTVDTTAPSVPGTPSTTSPTSSTTPTWSWTASVDSGGSGLAITPYTVQWSQDSGFSSGVSSSTSTTNSFTHSTALADGTWYFRIEATDVAGNPSDYSSNGMVVIDTTTSSNSNSNTLSSSSSSSAPTGCSNQAPTSSPDLFQIDTINTKATVYFAPSGMPYDNYVIRFGPTANNLLYSASFSRGFAPGVIYYTINELNPNTIYYFQVRAGNGCKPGDWGNTLSAKTTGSIKSTSKSYESLGGFIKSLLSSFSPKYTGPAINNSIPTTANNNTAKQCTQYTVLRGDSFWTIAQKLLGSGKRYLEIWKANTNTYPTLKNSPVIRAGWKLSVGC